MVKVNIMTPYAVDKNLGRAYNQAMSMIGDDEYGCLIDYDVQLLTPDAGQILHRYAEMYPDALLTCFTNRVHPCNKQQLRNSCISNDTNIINHIRIAEIKKQELFKVTEIRQHLSGFLMLMSKSLWKEVPFTEDKMCLGVDTDYFERLQAAGKKVLRMDGLYVWHTYRLLNGITNKSHLL